MKNDSKIAINNSKKVRTAQELPYRAVAPALVWGREPRDARRGQTDPKGAQNPKRALCRAAPGVVGKKHGKKKNSHPGPQKSSRVDFTNLKMAKWEIVSPSGHPPTLPDLGSSEPGSPCLRSLSRVSRVSEGRTVISGAQNRPRDAPR